MMRKIVSGNFSSENWTKKQLDALENLQIHRVPRFLQSEREKRIAAARRTEAQKQAIAEKARETRRLNKEAEEREMREIQERAQAAIKKRKEATKKAAARRTEAQKQAIAEKARETRRLNKEAKERQMREIQERAEAAIKKRKEAAKKAAATRAKQIKIKGIGYTKELYRFNPKYTFATHDDIVSFFNDVIKESLVGLERGDKVQIGFQHQSLHNGFWSSKVVSVSDLIASDVIDDITARMQSAEIASIDESMTIEKKKPRKHISKIIAFDFESEFLHDGEHRVKFTDCKNPNTTFIAHNGKGYDFHFLFKKFNDNGVKPKYISNGLKIISMVLPKFNIRFIDSMLFLPMGLSKLPSMFGLEEHVRKGYFPHWFKCSNDYKGVLPSLDDFRFDSMPYDKRADAQRWYKKTLRKCMKAAAVKLFREQFLVATDGEIDPWAYKTIASACMGTYRHMFMPEESIPTHHEEGMRRHSDKAVQWLEYLRDNGILDMRRVLRGGEKWIDRLNGKKFYADGYSPSTNTVYEFNVFETIYR
ncbi:uncharacterized protein SPPG_05488 [Spizellomyces punctatus DAOM BR117]|uniref:Probable DNA polymerase n=1 Tax=Spizellomyces punctatus (strain DAOM BR117) TaxID=645134 RepID=A0A0L0HDM8_SPIPD|nr:uncharacterized protein SPPG_05488 [Spizellomyces punctatus DAOM BR117]KNC99232.1 hypothetical protein SPPG_05488 [Spizellomyces punctatus DAOM BR117]|eukprot:XP_016607272.1 hypothetical protein SPPG_05488 [Spizellomyces punctatus DAOM BR117]